MAKLLFLTDLHGNTTVYEQSLQKAAELQVDALVFGGDLLPPPGASGNIQRDYVKYFLSMRFRDFRKDCSRIRIYMILGNYDQAAALGAVKALDQEGVIHFIHDRAARLDDSLMIAGYSFVPLTPFALKDWEKLDTEEQVAYPGSIILTDETGRRRSGSFQEDIKPRGTIRADMARLAGHSDPSRTVYVIHTPPHNTNLDLMYDRTHVGSRAVREFIEKYQPPLTLHGHIHESPTMSGRICDRIGRTLCINPGDSKTRLHGVLVDTADPEGSLRHVSS